MDSRHAEAGSNHRTSRQAGTLCAKKDMVGPNGLEPSTSSVSRKRSNQTELRAYIRWANFILSFTAECGKLAMCWCPLFDPASSSTTHRLGHQFPGALGGLHDGAHD